MSKDTAFDRCEKQLSEINSKYLEGLFPDDSKEFGGAGIRICSQERQSPADLIRGKPRTVITPNSHSLSWLIDRLKDAFTPLIDHQTKYEFYGRLANAALLYQARCNKNEVKKDLLFAVLQQAYEILDEMKKGTFVSLPVATERTIADDLKDV